LSALPDEHRRSPDPFDGYSPEPGKQVLGLVPWRRFLMSATAFRMAAFSLFLGLLLASGSRADDKKVELNVGDKAPAFEARTDADATWDSADRFGKKWVVVYFYPGDFTPG
jgi:hypothetical protein